jgi:hypothetical protein
MGACRAGLSRGILGQTAKLCGVSYAGPSVRTSPLAMRQPHVRGRDPAIDDPGRVRSMPAILPSCVRRSTGTLALPGPEAASSS